MWTFTLQRLYDAIERDADTPEAVLLPDGVTVLAPDGDLGFTVDLAVWIEAGGRDLTSRSMSPNTAPESSGCPDQ